MPSHAVRRTSLSFSSTSRRMRKDIRQTRSALCSPQTTTRTLGQVLSSREWVMLQSLWQSSHSPFLTVSHSSTQVRKWVGTRDSSSLRRTLFRLGRRTSTSISINGSSTSVTTIRLLQQVTRAACSKSFLQMTAHSCSLALFLATR